MHWDEIFTLIPSSALKEEFNEFLKSLNKSDKPLREDSLDDWISRLARLRFSMARHVHDRTLEDERQAHFLIELDLADKLVQDCLYLSAVKEGRRPLDVLRKKREK